MAEAGLHAQPSLALAARTAGSGLDPGGHKCPSVCPSDCPLATRALAVSIPGCLSGSALQMAGAAARRSKSRMTLPSALC